MNNHIPCSIIFCVSSCIIKGKGVFRMAEFYDYATVLSLIFGVIFVPFLVIAYLLEADLSNDYLFFIRKFQLKRMLKKYKAHSSAGILEKIMDTRSTEWTISSSMFENMDTITYPLSDKVEIAYQDAVHSQSIFLYVKGSRKVFDLVNYYVHRKELDTKDLFTNRAFSEEKEAIAKVALEYLKDLHNTCKNSKFKEEEQQGNTAAKEEKSRIEKAKISLRDLLIMNEIPLIKHYDKDGISSRIVTDNKENFKLTIFVQQEKRYEAFYYQKGGKGRFSSTILKEVAVEIDVAKMKADLDIFANRIGKSVLRSEQPTAGLLSEKQIKNKPLFINECHKLIESNLLYLNEHTDYLSFESLHVLEETVPSDLSRVILHQELIRTTKKEALINDSLHELLLMTNMLRKEVEETQIKELKITNQIIKNRLG